MYKNELTTDVETEAEAHFLAQLDYDLALGSEITVRRMTAYEGDDHREIYGDVLVRVMKTEPSWREEVRHDHLDTWWDVVLAEPVEAAAHKAKGLGLPSIDGPSYRILENLNPRENRVGE